MLELLVFYLGCKPIIIKSFSIFTKNSKRNVNIIMKNNNYTQCLFIRDHTLLKKNKPK